VEPARTKQVFKTKRGKLKGLPSLKWKRIRTPHPNWQLLTVAQPLRQARQTVDNKICRCRQGHQSDIWHHRRDAGALQGQLRLPVRANDGCVTYGGAALGGFQKTASRIEDEKENSHPEAWRVTEIFRSEGDERKLIHRHAGSWASKADEKKSK
jgi:hypothetical protein